MENRKKFYSDGLWGKDTLYDRYWHVMNSLDAYRKHILDEQDLVFVIKNAFVSKIQISEGVAKAYPAPQPLFGSLSGLYDQLYRDHELDLQDNPPVLNSTYMKICELGSVVSDLKSTGKLANDLPNVHVEHVVPGKVFMEEVKKITSFDDFKKIFDAVSICLVTADEDKHLDKNGLRSNMPSDVSDFTEVPEARYHEAGVIIY